MGLDMETLELERVCTRYALVIAQSGKFIFYSATMALAPTSINLSNPKGWVMFITTETVIHSLFPSVFLFPQLGFGFSTPSKIT